MLTFISTLATVSALVSGLLPMLQIRHMVKTRSAKGLAMPYLIGGLVNAVVWFVYGSALVNWPLIVSCSLNVTMNAAMLTVVAFFRHRGVVAIPSVGLMARTLANDPTIAAELDALVAEHHSTRRAEADTLILRRPFVAARA